MKTGLRIGTAQGRAGEITYGTFEGVQMPTGSSDDLPVIIAQGKREGPVLWVTASIHGNEYTGISAIHRLITPALVSDLRGAVIAIPTLNPAGLRVGERRAYYLKNQDPNRLFPAGSKKVPSLVGLPSDPEPISALENVYKHLFEKMVETADYLIDLHNYSLNSLPFSFRDPIGYADEHDKATARQLQTVMDGVLKAFGHTIINEYATADYLKRNLHRSVSGSVLNMARIPAFTVELGGYLSVDPAIVAACCAGIRNVMRFGGMLEGPMEPITDINILTPSYPIRRIQHPYAPQSGIMSHFVKSGDPVKRGEAIGRLTDIWGRPIGVNDGLIKTEHDGYVLGVSQGAAFYQGESLLSLAIRDDTDLLVPF
ncbi:MAG: succinylglutamate desuccinylase/aspartoacylase family protein [Anaerolineae bacterium]|nr:succinylglutamate desuccinylase/aspartoacylase family protein [Anaerolineae bacterium]